jgi:Pentapeptide repeats (8 copies)
MTKVFLLAVIGGEAVFDEIVAPAMRTADDFGNHALTLTSHSRHSSLAHYLNTNLSNADLSDANLNHAWLSQVDLTGANLSGADLGHVDLRDGMGLTQEQIDEAKGDERTLLPDNLQRPASWS